MEIAWFGRSCLRLRDRNTIAVADPYLPGPDFQNLKIKTDLVTLSRSDGKLRTVVPNVRSKPYTIDGPGEYEVGGIFVTAVWNSSTSRDMNGSDRTRPPSLICTFVVDGVVVCHLGQIEEPPSDQVLKSITPFDVLTIPPGGRGAFTRVEAAKLVATTSPKLVIPMAYGDGAASDDVAAFLEEAGLEAQEPTSAITVTRSSLPEDKIETVILESRTKEKKPSGAKSAAVGTDLEG